MSKTSNTTSPNTTPKRGRPRKIIPDSEKEIGRNKYMEYYREYGRERYHKKKEEQRRIQEEKDKIYELYLQGKLAKVKKMAPFLEQSQMQKVN